MPFTSDYQPRTPLGLRAARREAYERAVALGFVRARLALGFSPLTRSRSVRVTRRLRALAGQTTTRTLHWDRLLVQAGMYDA